jgi:hypothetical protein
VASVTPIVITATPVPAHLKCLQILRNADFEQNGSWVFGDTPLRGRYVNAPIHHGQRAVLLGNPNTSGPNKYSYSSIKQRVQLVAAGATHATLSFWYYPVSSLESGDKQEVLLLNPRTGKTIKILWRINVNANRWLYQSLDLTPWLGRDVLVYFNVFNNGGSGRAKMIVDDVSLQLCSVVAEAPAPTATPRPQIAPSATPHIILVTRPPAPPHTAQPVPTLTPAISPTATATQVKATPVNQITLPLITETSQKPETKPRTFWQIALKALSYALIIFIVLLIIIIALVMIRQANNRSNKT